MSKRNPIYIRINLVTDQVFALVGLRHFKMASYYCIWFSLYQVRLLWYISYSYSQEREKYVHQLELEIEQERNMADNLVSAMQPDLRDRYMMLKNQNMQFQVRMDNYRRKDQCDNFGSQQLYRCSKTCTYSLHCIWQPYPKELALWNQNLNPR